MIRILCAYCETETADLADEETVRTCAACGREFSVAAQEAYARGQAYYTAGLEIEREAQARKKKASSEMTDMIRYYSRAYSGLRVALKDDLPGMYSADALMMLAEITRRFLKHEMVSPLESKYWTQRITYCTTEEEYEHLQQRLAARSGNFLQRGHWRLRYGQLKRALPKLKEEIAKIEQEIAFVE